MQTRKVGRLRVQCRSTVCAVSTDLCSTAATTAGAAAGLSILSAFAGSAVVGLVALAAAKTVSGACSSPSATRVSSSVASTCPVPFARCARRCVSRSNVSQ